MVYLVPIDSRTFGDSTLPGILTGAELARRPPTHASMLFTLPYTGGRRLLPVDKRLLPLRDAELREILADAPA